MLASTTSPASLTSMSSVLVCKGDRGSAISPISKQLELLSPVQFQLKGDDTSSCRLENTERSNKLHKRINSGRFC